MFELTIEGMGNLRPARADSYAQLSSQLENLPHLIALSGAKEVVVKIKTISSGGDSLFDIQER